MQAAALRAQLDEQQAQYQRHGQERQEAALQIQLLQQELASVQVRRRGCSAGGLMRHLSRMSRMSRMCPSGHTC